MLAAQMELRPPRDANIVAAQLVPRVIGNFDFPRMDQKSAAAVISCGRDVSNEFRGFCFEFAEVGTWFFDFWCKIVHIVKNRRIIRNSVFNWDHGCVATLVSMRFCRRFPGNSAGNESEYLSVGTSLCRSGIGHVSVVLSVVW